MLRPLSEGLQEKAIKELGEDPKSIEKDIKNIKEWMKQQPHLNGREDDQWILAFLRGCKFSYQSTKSKLDSFYSVRTLWPEAASRDPFSPEIQAILKLNAGLPLRTKKDWTGPKVVYLAFENLDFSVISIDAFTTYCFMTNSILYQEDDNTTVSGIVVLYDMKNMLMNTLVHISPSIMKKYYFFMQHVTPIRIKGFHFLNVPSFANVLVTLFKSTLSKKLASRVHTYDENNYETLYDHIPKDCLPNEYGGTNGTLDETRENWKKKVESYAEWFKEDNNYCTNEALRVGKPLFENDFGIDGSFRKLNVD